MKSSKLLLAASLIGLCSIQGAHGMSFFSRMLPASYDKNKPCYGLNTKQNVGIIVAGYTALCTLAPLYVVRKQYNKIKNDTNYRQEDKRRDLNQFLLYRLGIWRY